MGPKSPLLTDIQRQSIDSWSQIGHFEETPEVSVKYLPAMIIFSCDTANLILPSVF